MTQLTEAVRERWTCKSKVTAKAVHAVSSANAPASVVEMMEESLAGLR